MWLPLAPRRPLYTTIPALRALMPSSIAVAAFARSRARALIHARPLALPSVRASSLFSVQRVHITCGASCICVGDAGLRVYSIARGSAPCSLAAWHV